MTMRIEMPDGKPYDPNETEKPNMKPDDFTTISTAKSDAENLAAANRLSPAEERELTERAVALVNQAVDTAVHERTLLVIAGELDRAQKVLADARLIVADGEEAVKRLVAEVRGFGRKPRAAKGAP